MQPQRVNVEPNGRVDGALDAAEAPPEWHGMSALPVEFRSLLHDPEAATEHEHETTELILNLGEAPGEILWRDENGSAQKASLAAQQCCFIPSGVRHVASGLRLRGAISLLVGGGLLAQVVRRDTNRVLVENLPRLAAQDGVVGGLVAEFSRVMVRQPHALVVSAIGIALALKLIHSFLYSKPHHADKRAALSPAAQRKVCDYLLAHSAESIDVPQLARHLAMSRTHFARRFRATYGMPPLQYALKMRVDHALELLRAGDCRVADAAYAVGFCDQSHLDRHCRKFYGRAPSALL